MNTITITDKNKDKIEKGLAKYEKIKELADNIDSDDFKKTFTSFYKVRRSQNWRNKFFDIFSEKIRLGKQQVSFKSILKDLQNQTNRIEASFASKMLHTIDDRKPIWDSVVLNHLSFKVHNINKEKRFDTIVNLYNNMCLGYNKLIETEKGKDIIKVFDDNFGKKDISEIKKIDFILWASKDKQILEDADLKLFK